MNAIDMATESSNILLLVVIIGIFVYVLKKKD